MADVQKFLVIKLKHLGDVLLASPVFQALQERFPHARITALVPRGAEELLENNPTVHDVLVFDRQVKSFSFSSLIAAEWTLIRELRRRKFDVVVELSDGDRGAILTRLTGAPMRLGYRRREGLLGRDRFFTHVAEHIFNKSVVESHADVLAPLGITPGLPPPRLFPTDVALAEALDLLRAQGVGPQERFVVFHPTSRWMFKSWEASSCARLAEILLRKWEVRVVLTCSPQIKELTKIRQILAQVREPVVDLAGKTTLSVLIALISKASAFVGVDSAPLHMAYALGIPTLSLFGPSDPVQWAPVGAAHRYVVKRWACQPCQRDGCLSSKISQCLQDLSVEEVAGVLDAWLPSVLRDKQPARIS